MAGHSNIVFTSMGAPNSEHIDTSNEYAYTEIVCPHCGKVCSAAVIARTQKWPYVTWVRCPGCLFGAVINGDTVSPARGAGEEVEGLPEDVEQAYNEARRNISASAYTSAELMCRKILMHVAVNKGAKEGDTFAEYLSFLESQGFVTPPMKPWVDLIRKRGNIATHELPASSKREALGTLSFTTQLLRSIYEMEYRAKQFMSDQDDDAVHAPLPPRSGMPM